MHFSLIHSFIINPSDNFVQTGFDPKEINEIINKEYGNKTLDIDENLLVYINSFAKVNMKDVVTSFVLNN